MDETLEPQPFFTIEDLETLRMLSDPLHMQMYEILLAGPASVRQVAERLGLASSRLYYHINQMEKQGLVKVVETRMVSNMLEKIYRARAFRLEIAPHLLHFGAGDDAETITGLVTGHLDATRDDLLRSFHARQYALLQGAPEHPRQVLVNRSVARIPDALAEDFHRRLEALIEEFSQSDVTEAQTPAQPQDEFQNYALLVAFYPSFYFKGDPQ